MSGKEKRIIVTIAVLEVFSGISLNVVANLLGVDKSLLWLFISAVIVFNLLLYGIRIRWAAVGSPQPNPKVEASLKICYADELTYLRLKVDNYDASIVLHRLRVRMVIRNTSRCWPFIDEFDYYRNYEYPNGLPTVPASSSISIDTEKDLDVSILRAGWKYLSAVIPGSYYPSNGPARIMRPAGFPYNFTIRPYDSPPSRPLQVDITIRYALSAVGEPPKPKHERWLLYPNWREERQRIIWGKTKRKPGYIMITEDQDSL
ncbi:MAG TPA: hypothetical protein VJ183_16300 [Chloroflexia bacterium]|nr:hypothetical protein [Chloroflexia bacterium]